METKLPDKPYETHWISAQMAALGNNIKEKIKVGTRIVQKRKSMFNSDMIDVEEDIFEERITWRLTGKYSDTSIDKEKLATDISNVSNEYYNAGYDLLQIIDVTEGRYNYKAKTGSGGGGESGMWGWGYGYGYSLTDGVILTFRKRSRV